MLQKSGIPRRFLSSFISIKLCTSTKGRNGRTCVRHRLRFGAVSSILVQLVLSACLAIVLFFMLGVLPRTNSTKVLQQAGCP